MKKQKLIFVYNANSGIFNSIKDRIHKTVSPQTYSCNLCRVTFGITSMKQKWEDFISSLNFKIEFLHKDEFLDKYNMKNVNFPSIFIEKEKKLKLLISNKKINNVQDLNGLVELVKKNLE